MGCVAPESNKAYAMGLGQSPSSGPNPSSRAEKVDLGQMWPFSPLNLAKMGFGHPKFGDSTWEEAKQLAGMMEVMAKRLVDGCDVPDGCCEPLPSRRGSGQWQWLSSLRSLQW